MILFISLISNIQFSVYVTEHLQKWEENSSAKTRRI